MRTFWSKTAILNIIAWCVCISATGDIQLSSDEKALVDIHIQPSGNKKIMETAKTLSNHLTKISGSEYAVNTNGIKNKGILLALTKSLDSGDKDIAKLLKMAPEAYMIKASGDKILLVGNSEKALMDASFNFLERLGCRWLVPSSRWIVIPENKNLSVKDFVIITQPDFAYRSIWYAYGMGVDESRKILARDYKLWFDANRLGGVALYKCGHTYPHTVGKHVDEFKEHPEYFAMQKDGTRIPYNKYKSLCYSNPDVVAVFLKDKIEELKNDKNKKPYAYTVSMDPNDGSEVCFCKKCQELGNGSDQALYLANQVAKGIRKIYPDAIVTMYVYASHRLPPEKVKAEPNINVQVAMGFNKTKYTLPELVAEWKKRVPAFGIRDYFGVMAWDWGLPGRGKASSFPYVKKWIPIYKTWNATSFNAETNANWATFGPATYVATKLLWNTKADSDKIYNDFMSHAFGSASEKMKELYSHWQEGTGLSIGNLNLWLSTLNEAIKQGKNESPQVRGRLTDIAAYLHYVILFKEWNDAKYTKNRSKCYDAVKKLLEFTWQIRERQMVHSYALQRRLVNSGDKVLRPLEKGWHFKDPNAVWKNKTNLTDNEIIEIFNKDLLKYPPDSRIKKFSTVFKKFASTEKSKNATIGGLRYKSTWYVIIDNDDHLKFKLPIVGVRHNYSLQVFSDKGKLVWKTSKAVKGEKRYDMKKFEMDLVFPKPGQYKIVFYAGEDYRPEFPANINAVVECTENRHSMFRFFGNTYFYVPTGTKEILLKTDGRVSLMAPSSKHRKDILPSESDKNLKCNVIPVGNDDGKIWTISPSTSAKFYFLNIPPYVSPSPGQMLIPSDVEVSK